MSEEKLPKGWERMKISDVAEIVSGIGFPKDLQGKTAGKFPFFKVGDISRAVKSGRKLLEQAESYIDDEEKKFLKAKELPKNTIVFAKIGEALKLNRRGILSGPSFIDNNVMGLIPNRNIENLFLYYFLVTEDLGKYSSGNTVPSIRKSSVAEIEISLPPLPEQQRIVARLDAIFGHLDVLREKLDRIPVLLKNFRQQVLTQAVTGELTREWRGKTQFRIDGPYEIPKNWVFKKLSELSKSLKYGSSSKSLNEGEVPVLRMGNLQNGEIDWTDLKYSVDKHEIEKYLLKKGDVLFNRTNSPELVGKTSIFRGGRKVIYAGYLIKIETTEDLDPEFLNYILNSYYAKKWCLEVKTDGVSQSNINAKKLGSLLIPKPSLEEQQEIVKRVKALFDLADKIESQYQSLKAKIDQMPQAILAKAFRGELVGEEVKEYVREIEELGMVAEKGMKTFEVSKTSKV